MGDISKTLNDKIYLSIGNHSLDRNWQRHDHYIECQKKQNIKLPNIFNS